MELEKEKVKGNKKETALGSLLDSGIFSFYRETESVTKIPAASRTKREAWNVCRSIVIFILFIVPPDIPLKKICK